MSATLATLLTTLAGLIVPAIADALVKWAQGQQDVAAAKTQGANEAIAAVNKESADAQERMSAANAAPRSGDLAASRLRDGTF